MNQKRGRRRVTGGEQRAIDESERSFLRALDVARRLGARSLELRAASSLAMLWRRIGRAEAARQALSPVYRWFTEGLDTPDLKAALGLLRKLEA